MAPMLAYVFWHWPVRDAGYEEALLEFHPALAANPSARVSRLARQAHRARPWLHVPRAYEDWYLVDDFAALGALNDAATSGPRRAPHDGIAALPAGAVAALYGWVGGVVGRPRHAAFRSKPAGMSYASYRVDLPRDVASLAAKDGPRARPRILLSERSPARRFDAVRRTLSRAVTKHRARRCRCPHPCDRRRGSAQASGVRPNHRSSVNEELMV